MGRRSVFKFIANPFFLFYFAFRDINHFACLPLDLGNKLSPSKKLKTCTSSENVAVDFGTAPRLQIMADKQAILDKDEEEYVRSWELLQNDIEGLHSIYADLHDLVQVSTSSCSLHLF